MDIKQLKFLIALDETRHFGQAAARCHITQPTLSMRLRSLEEELQLPLVNRGQRFEGFTAPANACWPGHARCWRPMTACRPRPLRVAATW